MSSCRCCLTSHPLRLIERLNSSIQTIKLIRRNCSIFESILLDEYEQLERVLSNLNQYLMHYGTISNQIFTYLSQFIIHLNNRLANLTKLLYEFECLTIKCSIWLKNNCIKSIRTQLKHYGKQLDLFIHLHEQSSHLVSYKHHLTKNISHDFSIFQSNYRQQCLQMDSIEREHMKLFIESLRLFSLIISSENNQNLFPIINIDQDINKWKEKNKFHLTWLPDEHQQKENHLHSIVSKLVKQSSSDIEIKAIDNCISNNEEKYAYESNLSWSFTIPKTKEDFSIPFSHHRSIEKSKSSQASVNIIKSLPINRVRQAIEAIERNNKSFSRERKS